jgi:integrase
MAKEKITKRFLDGLELGKRQYIFDTELHGFGVHVGAQEISFFVQYRAGFGRKGKAKRVRFGKFGPLTVEQARKQAQQLLAQATQGEDLSRKRQEELPLPTFTELWKAYITAKPNLKGMTTDKNRFEKHLKPLLGALPVDRLKPAHVERIRLGMEAGHKPATVRNTLELLRRLHNFGVAQQLCSPLSFKIKLPKVNNTKTEDLTPEQLKRLWQAIEDEGNFQAANLMRLALLTGMRRGELFRLQWEHIDTERGFIRLVDTKGGVDNTIPLSADARNVLEQHPRIGDSPYVFPGRNGQQRVDINTQVNRIKERAGLPKDFRALHGLRHVYASTLASCGKVDMYTLQKLLTHKSPAMTQRYAHLRDEALRNASELAGSLLITNHEE